MTAFYSIYKTPIMLKALNVVAVGIGLALAWYPFSQHDAEVYVV